MKKGSLLVLAVCLLAQAKSQSTWFTIRSFDKSATAGIEVYSGDSFLGTTTANGMLELTKKTVYFYEIKLFRENMMLDYEINDTSTSFIVIGGKNYLITVMPKRIEEVVVQATRASSTTPTARTEIKKEDIALQNTGRDLPVLMQLQPSVVITSDAGNGVGYTGIRVRGSDATRTNVTINGVPINDAESQGTYWVDMPDLASSVGNIQVQRGVGSSSNGAGAFGATINVQTLSGYKPYGLISNSLGSFGTRKHTLAAGTGLINGHWTIDMRISKVNSNGYIDRASSELSSYFLSAGYVSKKWSLKLLHFAGSEHTYQAWYGIPIEKLKGDINGMNDQYNRNLGYVYRNASDSLNFYQSGNRTYNYYTYPNETDNYKQAHYHAYFNYNFSQFSRLNTTLYYTRGEGYYEQFLPNDPVANYGLSPAVFGSDTIRNSDIIRRQWLKNNLYGANANYNYERNGLNLTIGGGYNMYRGDHYGEIVWARIVPDANYLQHYYNSTGDKNDGNIFAKAVKKINNKLFVYADMQYRMVHHQGYGNDENLNPVAFSKTYQFFNPKAGFTWERIHGEQLYASVCVGHREPSRSDFTDNKAGQIPKPEELTDFELGWKKYSKKYAFEANFYYMDYNNQLVLTGAVNDVGTPLRVNVPKSYRAGLELSGSAIIVGGLSFMGNVTVSRNRIKEIKTETSNYIDGTIEINTHKNVPISYSPDVTSAATLQYKWKNGLALRWVHKYVSRQFLDNTGNKTRVVDAYYFSEFWLNKNWKLSNGLQIEAQFQVLNLFNNLYNNNGYTYDYITGTPSAPQRIQEVYLFPSATRSYLGGVVLKF